MIHSNLYLCINILRFIMVTRLLRVSIGDSEGLLSFNETFYEAEVYEDAALNHIVLTVNASSYNETSNIRYEIADGNIGGAFGVVNTTGAIYVAAPLDYETLKKYQLTLVAFNNYAENFTNVTIRVKDVNDNPPSFVKDLYTAEIMEEDYRDLPKKILQVVAIDGDTNSSDHVIYFASGQGIDVEENGKGRFEVNRTTGEIYVLQGLDRDPPYGYPQWRFAVFAQDDDGKGHADFTNIHILVKDINDNPPIFLFTVFKGQVLENASADETIVEVKAIDYDDPNEGDNTNITYSIRKNVIDEESGMPIFKINPHTGVIKTAICCLDREKTPNYTLQVAAVDGGGLKNTADVLITIEDINDNPPQFTKNEWVKEINETFGDKLPTEPILVVTVFDQDEHNDFFYKVVPNSGFGAEKFGMFKNPDNSGSLKVIAPLDYENPWEKKGYRFRIQVSDKGENGTDENHVAYSWIVIKLKDVNDNAPQFQSNYFSVSIEENAEIGTMLDKINAIDPDQDGKCKILYKLDRTSDRKRQFNINQEGVVSIQKSLDREDIPKYELKVLAIDDGTPSNTATATLTINILDVNDNAPKFAEDYRPVLLENSVAQKIIEIYAIDDDDKTKGNGPPFQFRLDPTANDDIRSSFEVKQYQSSEGMAIVSSTRSFDRETQKEYLIPIMIKDAGYPTQTATRTLTVIIGDINDNKMSSGTKKIFVFNYQGQAPDTDIGSVYVDDIDDWDIPDKRFYWNGLKHPKFSLNEESGMIQMKRRTRSGVYHLRFKVSDRKHNQNDVPANVTVTIQDINRDSVLNAGSIRLSGITDHQVFNDWDYKTKTVIKSIYEKFREKIAQIFNLDKKYVNIFSVQCVKKDPPLTDIRFGINLTKIYKADFLNGMISIHQIEIERELGVNIEMISINECLNENNICKKGSCTNVLEISEHPYLINANRSAFGGVNISVQAECVCRARNYSEIETCRPNPCLNGGRCVEGRYGVSCSCSDEYNGPRCQQTTRSFHGDGLAWYPALELCENSHLSFDFITQKKDGIFLYNGPLTMYSEKEMYITDFLSIELQNGYPRLLINFGSETTGLLLKTRTILNDGEWHRIDIFWNKEIVRMIVDFCKSSSVTESEDGAVPVFNTSMCQVQSDIPPSNEYLNLNMPLQIGGLFIANNDSADYNVKHMPIGKSFDGCIKDIRYNGELYDLAHPAFVRNSSPGCTRTDSTCRKLENSKKTLVNGVCVGNYIDGNYTCDPGYTGENCDIQTVPTTFKSQSYVKFALNFELDQFMTQLQLRFRTRERLGELFRLSDQFNHEYGILGIENATLHFRYNLNSQKNEENDIYLNMIKVDDGQWHVVKINRYGSTVILELDGGEGRYYNETFLYEGHQLLLIDKQNGIYAGGKPEYTGISTFYVDTDFKDGCIDDIRIEGKHLPLPPAMIGSQWGQATMAQNLDKECASQTPCINVSCLKPFECVDLWNGYECTCEAGRVITPNGKDCMDKNECLDQPCLNDGMCVDLDPKLKYICICPDGYWGENCEFVYKEHILKFSMGAIISIIISTTIIISFVLILIIYNCRKRDVKHPHSIEDVRENVIDYAEEGGGENDVTVFNIETLQIPVDELSSQSPIPLETIQPVLISPSDNTSNIKIYIELYQNEIDKDENAPPFDDLRNYAYEGDGSIADLLSTIVSDSEEDDQDFEYLHNWGPKFQKVAGVYDESENDQK